jgi:O-antigen ligase
MNVQTSQVTRLSYMLAASILALMPLAVWLQGRSAVFVLVLVAACCLVGTWQDDRGKALRARIAGYLTTPLAMYLILFLFWCLISMSWSHAPAASMSMFGELVLPMIAGVIVATALPGNQPHWTGALFLCSLGAALILTVLELRFGTALRGQFGMRTHSFIFNRTLITLLLLFITGLAFVASQRQHPLWPASKAIFMIGLLSIMALFLFALFQGESGAVVLGAAIACFAGGMVWLLPRISFAAYTAGLVALTLFAPVQGEIADRLLPASIYTSTKETHSRDRVEIWQSFGEAIRKRPLTGAGFGTSGTYDKHPVVDEIPAMRRTLLGAGHPHSMPVQVWAETGLVGALLLLLAALAFTGVLWRIPMRLRVFAFAATCGALAIAGVGHGAWQGWWIASLAASCCWIALALHGPSHDMRDDISNKNDQSVQAI